MALSAMPPGCSVPLSCAGIADKTLYVRRLTLSAVNQMRGQMFMSQRFLTIYSGVLTLVFAVTVFSGFSIGNRPTTFDQINVHRINVVEPDGTLRMVISDHAKLPGIITRGKEQPFARPQAGMIFYNDEGSENGGLIIGGHRNAKAKVVDSA